MTISMAEPTRNLRHGCVNHDNKRFGNIGEPLFVEKSRYHVLTPILENEKRILATSPDLKSYPSMIV
jgi:hypothetical protein